MDAKNFLRIKPKQELKPQPVVQTKLHPELEARSEQKSELVVQTQQPLESIDRSKPKPDIQLEFLPEPGNYLESVAMIDREESIGGSGWGYSELLKEFRNDLKSD